MARILLVDDEKVARTLYGEYLTAAGHSVSSVTRLSEARTALAAQRFDAVVTDLILPEGDGMEVLRHVKERHSNVEVIVITALDKVDPAVRAIKSGAAEYLVKPVPPEVLQHAVQRALATRELLRENVALRQYVSLLEMGQRIATTMEREKLAAVTTSAFEAVASASAVLLFDTEGSEAPRLRGVHGLSAEQAEDLAPVLVPQLRALDSPRELDTAPAPFLAALAFPAADGGEVLGHAVLLYSTAPLENVFVPAGYLARNYGLALRTQGRFAAVEDLAYIDDLTHLFNVRYLHMVVDREVHNFQQFGGVFSLLFLDLDRFKSVNDTHGHLVGSKLLVEVARVVRGCVRDNDVVARYGGDEYVVVLRNTDSKGAQRVAERIRRTVEAHRFLAREGLSLSLTTCIGVASFPEHARDKATLLDMADRAMYRGKRGTRNGVYLAADGLEATPADRHSAQTG